VYLKLEEEEDEEEYQPTSYSARELWFNENTILSTSPNSDIKNIPTQFKHPI